MRPMGQPWKPERVVDAELARALLEEAFADLGSVRVEPFGVGWDNTSYLVNDELVFRFPRREIAVGLLEQEIRILPELAPHLPLPVPVPTHVGEPTERFPWPFAGYRLIRGRTADTARLDTPARERAAGPLGAFLAALHGQSAVGLREHGVVHDELDRLDLRKRIPRVEERLGEAVEAGLLDDLEPWRAILDEAPRDWIPGRATLVHGDLYARHVLVDDGGAPCGVIDWGDLHLGDPATDLSLAAGFLPPEARGAFREAYGPIDPDTWRMARFRALFSAAAVVAYGHDTGDRAMLVEGLVNLDHLREA